MQSIGLAKTHAHKTSKSLICKKEKTKCNYLTK